jgi:hypothetical protein
MATATAACPECGSATSPGRYTCPTCGAFLDGVAVAPRSWERETTPEPEPAHEPAVAAAGPASVPGEDAIPGDTGDPLVADGPALDPVEPSWPPSPDVLRDVQWPTHQDPAPSAARLDTAPPSAAPPAGLPPLAAPQPRVPAGAWLPPSALLTGLDETGVAGTAAAALPGAAAGSAGATTARDWLTAFGSLDGRWSAARRLIAVGAAVAVVGFVLPWANGSVGNLLTVWTSVWGLAGAGSWLVVLGMAAFAVVASSSGRLAGVQLAGVQLGVPALLGSAFLLGLIWPSLLGASGRPIGVLVVFAGALLLGVGGALHPGARHEAATPHV